MIEAPHGKHSYLSSSRYRSIIARLRTFSSHLLMHFATLLGGPGYGTTQWHFWPTHILIAFNTSTHFAPFSPMLLQVP